MTNLRQWLVANQSLISNSGALVGTAMANSGLGFVYWWLAALYFEESAVGLASAVVSAMVLLGSMAMLGLGTLLVGELPKRKGDESALIATSMLAVLGTAVIAALLFAVGAALLVDEFDLLVTHGAHTGMFIVGVVLTAITLMLDQAFIGLLRGDVQFVRNLIASLIKVGIVLVIGRWFADETGIATFNAWVIGMVLSMIIPFGYLVKTYGAQVRIRWRFLRELGSHALVHHWLNLVLDAPIRALPVIVTVVLSAATNASFYVAWMMAALLFFPVQSLTLVLFAVSSENRAVLAEKLRSTLRLSLLIAVVGYMVMFIMADFILGIFSENYAATAADALRIVSFAAFPLIVRDHFVAIYRIHDQTRRAAQVITVGAALEITLATLGGVLGNLNWLSAGWVCAISLQALYMAPTVWQTAHIKEQELSSPVGSPLVASPRLINPDERG